MLLICASGTEWSCYRDFNLPKNAAEHLSYRLKEKNFLDKGTKILYFRTRHEELMPFFTMDKNLVYCKSYRVFVDSSRQNLKWVPLAHPTTVKEKYEETKVFLEINSYYEHNWVICLDLERFVGKSHSSRIFFC